MEKVGVGPEKMEERKEKVEEIGAGPERKGKREKIGAGSETSRQTEWTVDGSDGSRNRPRQPESTAFGFGGVGYRGSRSAPPSSL